MSFSLRTITNVLGQERIHSFVRFYLVRRYDGLLDLPSRYEASLADLLSWMRDKGLAKPGNASSPFRASPVRPHV
jgi:hypothetical protein